MRSSIIGTASIAIGAAVALAACGGHGGVVPSQGFAPAASNGVASDGFAAGPDAKKSPCDINGMYYFKGSCRSFNLNMNKSTTVKLGQFGAYHGIKITTTFSAFTKPPQVPSVPAVMGDAIGDHDITGLVKGKAFKLYGDGKDCVYAGKPATCPGKPFVYAELVNLSKYTLKPELTPKFVISDSNGFPTGKNNQCFPAEWTSKGWLAETNIHGTPKGGVLTINALKNTENLYYPAHSQFMVAGVCY